MIKRLFVDVDVGEDVVLRVALEARLETLEAASCLGLHGDIYPLAVLVRRGDRREAYDVFGDALPDEGRALFD